MRPVLNKASHSRPAGRQFWLLLALLAAAGCRPAATEPPQQPAEPAALAAAAAPGSLAFESETRERYGLRLEALAAAIYVPDVPGFATVLSAEPLAELDADLARAGAGRDQAENALARAEALYAAEQSASLASLETARREEAIATAEVERAANRLAFAWGAASPFRDGGRRHAWLARLAEGRAALARLELPLGSPAPAGTAFEVTPLGAAGSADPLHVALVWPAAGDPARPGPSWLALLTGENLPQPGERLQVAAHAGAPLHGVLVPAAALVLEDGAAWVYAVAGEKLARKPLSLIQPLHGGYFMAAGFTAGEQVVVHGAGLLLALETGSLHPPSGAG